MFKPTLIATFLAIAWFTIVSSHRCKEFCENGWKVEASNCSSDPRIHLCGRRIIEAMKKVCIELNMSVFSLYFDPSITNVCCKCGMCTGRMLQSYCRTKNPEINFDECKGTVCTFP